MWRRDWVCVGVEQQIPEAGDLLPATLGDSGLHVQRLAGGELRAAFNVLQQGSCWTIPAQCSNGHKTRCPYVACGYSRDTDAFSARDGQPTDVMRQFIGFNALKLVDVPLQRRSPLVFVSLRPDAALSLDEQLGDLGSAVRACGLHALRYLGRFWLELQCPWTLATDALFAALGAPGSCRFSEDVPAPPGLSASGRARLWRAFPNLVVAALPDHVACLVIKPVRTDGVDVVVALYGGASAEPEVGEALVERWKAVLQDARRRAPALDDRAGSPILARARERLGLA